MRTVSFSNPNTQRFLNQHFVNTFSNTTGDATSGKSIWHQPKEPAGQCIRGNGKQNVQTLFLTPEGDIFHVATGFLSPKDLLTESRFAENLFKQLRKSSQDNTETVVDTHQRRLAEDGFSQADIKSRNPMAQMMAGIQLPGIGDFAFNLNQRQPQNKRPGQGAFASMINQQYLTDNQFSIRNPMMSWRQLERDPTPLVGNGKSFFSSSSFENNR